MYEWQTHKRVVLRLMKLMDVEQLCSLARRMLASKMFPCEPKSRKSMISVEIKE
jgi:hypothetical protein